MGPVIYSCKVRCVLPCPAKVPPWQQRALESYSLMGGSGRGKVSLQ